MQSKETINYLVEGFVDAVIARVLIEHVGGVAGMERISRGKPKFMELWPKYNEASKFQKWLALRDLDADAMCAPDLIAAEMANSSKYMCLRIAVKEVESWLIADRAAFANSIGVSVALMPLLADQVADPKKEVVSLARRSRKRFVLSGLVPERNSGIPIGPEYASWMADFASNIWNPLRASETGASPSLTRALNGLGKLILAE